MMNALKTFFAKLMSTEGCGCGPTCRCGSDCRCKEGEACGARCGCGH